VNSENITIFSQLSSTSDSYQSITLHNIYDSRTGNTEMRLQINLLCFPGNMKYLQQKCTGESHLHSANYYLVFFINLLFTSQTKCAVINKDESEAFFFKATILTQGSRCLLLNLELTDSACGSCGCAGISFGM
jgi:hypothetical protein